MTYYEEIVDGKDNFFLKRIYVEKRMKWTPWTETKRGIIPVFSDSHYGVEVVEFIKSEGRFIRVRGLKRLLMGGVKFVEERRSLYEYQVRTRVECQDTGVPKGTDDILRERTIDRARMILDARIEAREVNDRIKQAVYDGEI